MKPLTDYTEAELLGAGDEEIVGLLEYHFDIKEWPLSGNGMLEILEAMKEKYLFASSWSYEDQAYWFSFEPMSQTEIFYGSHASLPRAVAVAALLAVKGANPPEVPDAK